MSEGSPKTEMMNVSKLAGDGPEVTLVVSIAGGAAKRYPMRQASMTVGRSDQSDIPIKEQSVSSKHGEFTKSGADVVFRDLGSSNGTFVNDQRVQEATLGNGDTVRLGNQATITIEIGGGAPRKAAAPAPADNENPGSTAMISAADLDAMRRNGGGAPPPPAPRAAPPRPKPAPPPPPMPMPLPVAEEEESGGSKLPLIIGIVVVVLVLAGVGGFFAMKSAKHKRSLEQAAAVQAQAEALLAPAANPCNAAEEPLRAMVKDATDNPPPTGNYKAVDRPKNFRWVSAARDRASTAKRLSGTSVDPIRTAAAAAKTAANAIEEDAIKTKALEVAAALEARAQLAEEFVGAAAKLAKELDDYANLGEAAYVFGKADSIKEFGAFSLSKEPVAVLKACKNGHDTNKTDVEEKLGQLKAAIGQ